MLTDGAFGAIGSGVSALGSLASTFIAASMGSKGQYRSYKYNKKLQQQQYNLQQQGYREGPTNARYGLEAAGINPILAANNGSAFAGAGSGGSVGSPSYPTTPDLGNGLTNAFKAFNLEKKQTEANVDNLGSQTKANNAEAEYKRQLTQNEQVKQGIYELQKIEQEYTNDMKKFDRDTQQYRFAQEMKEMASRTKLNLQTAMFTGYNAVSNRIAANAQQENAITNKKQQILNELTSIQEQKYRDEHPFYNWADRWTSVAGRVFGGAGAAAQGYSAVKNSNTNAKGVYSETAKFDANGSYRGHTRTTRRRSR